jgi:hypothetical protein
MGGGRLAGIRWQQWILVATDPDSTALHPGYGTLFVIPAARMESGGTLDHGHDCRGFQVGAYRPRCGQQFHIVPAAFPAYEHEPAALHG